MAINFYSYDTLHKMYDDLGEEGFKRILKEKQVTLLQPKLDQLADHFNKL